MASTAGGGAHLRQACHAGTPQRRRAHSRMLLLYGTKAFEICAVPIYPPTSALIACQAAWTTSCLQIHKRSALNAEHADKRHFEISGCEFSGLDWRMSA